MAENFVPVSRDLLRLKLPLPEGLSRNLFAKAPSSGLLWGNNDDGRTPARLTTRQSLQRIGLVMPLSFQQGGAEALFQHLLRQGSERLHYFVALLQDGPFVEVSRSLGYDTAVFPTTHLSDPANFAQTVRGLRRWMRAKELNVVFSWMLKAHFYVAPAAAFTSVRTAWFQHGIPINGTMDRLATLLPTSVIFCCSDHGRAAQDQLAPRRKSFTCYPGVSFPPGEPIPQDVARKKLGLSPAHRIVGMVARWERWKGSHIFIEAAKVLLAEDRQLTCFLVGGAHPLDLVYAAEIHAQVAQADLRDRFLLVGQRPAAEIPLWHASADLIVHPVTSPEPFGMAVAEAMCMGRVVVASALGGPEEIIQDGVSGVLIPPGNAVTLTQTIQELVRDGDRRARLAAAARLRGRSFSVEAFAKRFEDLLIQTSIDSYAR